MRAVAVAALLALFVPWASGFGPAKDQFGGDFTMTLTLDSPVGVRTFSGDTHEIRPALGVVSCPENAGPGIFSPWPGTSQGGGRCPEVAARIGDHVEVTACQREPLSGSGAECHDVAYYVCIDGNRDGFCRSDDPADEVRYHACGGVDGQLGGFYSNRTAGPVVVFVDRPDHRDPAVCVPVRGNLRGFVVRNDTTILPECSDGIDNDGNGVADTPADPGCYATFDKLEMTVPPQYVLYLERQRIGDHQDP